MSDHIPEPGKKVTPQSPEAGGYLDDIVRHYIVQERYRHIPQSPQWWDDPEQAAGTERTPELAAGWLAKDCRDVSGHADAFEHQIIERTERVYHPASDVDRMLSLPNVPGQVSRNDGGEDAQASSVTEGSD